MRFLIVSKQEFPFPSPEVAGALLGALKMWAKQYTANKKMEQVWGFAGSNGGGGILNVNSLEELDAVMTEYPIATFAKTTIYPLTDLDRSLDGALSAVKKMTMMPRG